MTASIRLLMGKNYPQQCDCEPLFPSISSEILLEFEAWLGTELPTDYREFLQEWNGVQFRLDERQQHVVCPTQQIDDHSAHTPDWGLWRPDQRRSVFDSICKVGTLFGLSERSFAVTEGSLWQSKDLFQFHIWVPPRFILIGEAEYSITMLCMSLEGADRGHIYDWVTPIEPPVLGENCPTVGGMGWIAPNFREFWNSLHFMSNDELNRWVAM